MLFAKNSDRDPYEAQNLVVVPASNCTAGDPLKCTYVEVEQVDHTHEVFLCQPYWMWGAEMGANEHGLVIGNEALFTRVPVPKVGLLGMDILRLALERTKETKEALDCITGLLQKYGQGGNCSQTHGMYYQNSFLIGDGKTAYVLETIGKEWAAKKVETTYAISNCITLGSDIEEHSPGLFEDAQRRGLSKSPADFSLRQSYTARFMTWAAGGRKRCDLATRRMQPGGLTPQGMMDILRTHQNDGPVWVPKRGSNADVCMHHQGVLRPSRSVNSLVAWHSPHGLRVFATGTPTPCLSVFNLTYVPGSGVPLSFSPGQETSNEASTWWQWNTFAEASNMDYASIRSAIEGPRKTHEDAEVALAEGPTAVPDPDSFERAGALLRQWTGLLPTTPA
jgi:dipeptidase